ncbi:hypothetical protein AB4Y72_16465 [Arthrobacter sp. YAF34]|uniref:hypothetical protein n=1 Tax=Arthrobacter sp. YAF34 TaxID=3233083 RepID=UPI003F91A9D2
MAKSACRTASSAALTPASKVFYAPGHMRHLYRTGGCIGDPEDMREDIEAEERCIARLTREAASV